MAELSRSPKLSSPSSLFGRTQVPPVLPFFPISIPSFPPPPPLLSIHPPIHPILQRLFLTNAERERGRKRQMPLSLPLDLSLWKEEEAEEEEEEEPLEALSPPSSLFLPHSKYSFLMLFGLGGREGEREQEPESHKSFPSKFGPNSSYSFHFFWSAVRSTSTTVQSKRKSKVEQDPGRRPSRREPHSLFIRPKSSSLPPPSFGCTSKRIKRRRC